MSWGLLLLTFVSGLVAGFTLAYSRLSKVRRLHDEYIQKSKEAFVKEDQERLVKFQEDYNRLVKAHRVELNKLIAEEMMIRAEMPERDQLN